MVPEARMQPLSQGRSGAGQGRIFRICPMTAPSAALDMECEASRGRWGTVLWLSFPFLALLFPLGLSSPGTFVPDLCPSSGWEAVSTVPAHGLGLHPQPKDEGGVFPQCHLQADSGVLPRGEPVPAGPQAGAGGVSVEGTGWAD